jgi:hypothetical protein
VSEAETAINAADDHESGLAGILTERPGLAVKIAGRRRKDERADVRPACGLDIARKRTGLRTLAKSQYEEFAEQNEGRRMLTATHRTRILRRDCSRQLLVAPPKAPTSAAQASSHFPADDRPEETAAELLASLLTRSREDFVARLTGGGAFGRRGSWRSCCSD